ncbi:phytosulfokines [Beta vulgaris subsp. vulgaris]|uniref:phytosulfokines n=1 Tax=Beta vulgaris subsp. vulgaris TaxID=3555 RepID=UPI0005401040|nr:phytosulfokines [Beta vulgaris subsp. vulgaris]
MSKCTTLLIIALLVCFASTVTYAARPIPAFRHKDMEFENLKVDDNESCQGVNEEECLMRRTLVAHTDYIYTQHQNPSN